LDAGLLADLDGEEAKRIVLCSTQTGVRLDIVSEVIRGLISFLDYVAKPVEQA
jgi:hypothetical protein